MKHHYFVWSLDEILSIPVLDEAGSVGEAIRMHAKRLVGCGEVVIATWVKPDSDQLGNADVEIKLDHRRLFSVWVRWAEYVCPECGAKMGGFGVRTCHACGRKSYAVLEEMHHAD